MDEKEQIKNEVIKAYRNIIEERYQYESLSKQYVIPNSFDKDRIAVFRNYFLSQLYPEPQKRKALDEAFEHLDQYIKHPKKLLRILLDSTKIVFRFGRYLPKILNAGIKALRSFRTATIFENRIIQVAQNEKLTPPYSKENVEGLIQKLDYQEIQNFINHNEQLFEIMHDRTLVKKIIEIVDHLILSMKKHPKIYSLAEIQGLEIGKNIIVQGDALFAELNREDQKLILDFVVKIEREVLERLFIT